MMAAQSALAYAVGLQASFGVIDDGKQGRQCTVFFLFLLFSLFFSSEKTTRHATYCSTTRGRQHRSPDGVQWPPCAHHAVRSKRKSGPPRARLPHLRRGAEGKALLCVVTAERRMRERLIAVLGKHEQRAHLLCDLPHQAGVVDVLLDRGLVPCGSSTPSPKKTLGRGVGA